MAYCPNKKLRFYTNLVSAFKEKNPTWTDKEADDAALEVWMKTELDSFNTWYGTGARDSFGNPILAADNTYVNDKGEKISIFDMGNSEQFSQNEKSAAAQERIDEFTAKAKKVSDNIKDVLTKKIRLLKNTKRGEDHLKALSDLKDELDKADVALGIGLFQATALRELNNSYNSLQSIIQDKSATIRTFRRYRRYVSAYNILDEVQNLVSSHPEEFNNVDRGALAEAIRQRNWIQNELFTHATPLIAEQFASISAFIGKDEVIKWLENAPFDVTAVDLWTGFVGDSNDPILALTAKLWHNSYEKGRKEHISFRHELVKFAEKLEDAKGNPSNVLKLFEDLLEKDLNGKLTGYYLSEFRRAEFEKERNKYLDRIKEIEDTNSEEFKKARKDYRDWLQKNVVQKYIPAYYEILNSLSDEARDARDKIRHAKDAVMKKYERVSTLPNGKKVYTKNTSNITDEDWEKIREFERQLNWLKSDYNEDGTEKDERQRKIAKELRDYAIKMDELYENVGVNKEGFERAKKKAFDSGDDAYHKWLIRNATITYSKAFWNEFQRLVAIIRQDDIGLDDIQEKLNSLLKPFKDEDGVVNGSDPRLTDEIRDKVQELVEEKRIIKQGAAMESYADKIARLGKDKIQKIAKARADLDKLVEYLPTPYYEQEKAEKKATLSRADFIKWYEKNHYYNQFLNSWQPINIWTTLVPRDEKHIDTAAPNKHWFATEVKAKYLNPEYREDDNGWAVPTSNWTNKQFDDLKSKPQAVQDFYKFMVDSLKSADKRIPPGYRLGYRIPFIRKNVVQRIIDAGTQNAVSVVKESIKDRFAPRTDDIAYGQLTDESGKPVNHVPVFFTTPIPVEEMSFDLTTLLSSFYLMSLNYENYSEIIDTVETVRDLVEKRKITRTNADDKPIVNKLKGLINKEITKEGVDSNSLKQLQTWIDMYMYGQMNESLGVIDILGNKIATDKLLDNLNAYTSYSLLAVNFIAGTVNLLQGEAANWSETGADRFFGKNEYLAAAGEYNKDTMEIVADIGSRVPKAKINFLNELLDTLGKYQQNTSNTENQWYRRMMKSDALFFTQNIGEHRLQSKVMIAMMKKLIPLDKDGKKIEGLASMYDAYQKGADGNWKLDERVANFDSTAQAKFTRQMQGIIRTLHGNYGETTKVKWQRDARLRLLGAMRRWIMPGVRRRWYGKRDNEFMEIVTEGMYRTTGRFIGNWIKSLNIKKGQILRADWKSLDQWEKENIRRTVIEAAEFALAAAASAILYAMAGGDDKDKRAENTALLFMAYATKRLRNELAFYTGTSALQILRSPAASVSLLEGVSRLVWQLGDPTERYERGPRKGDLKIWKKIEDVTPFYRHFRRAFTNEGIQEQISWLFR